MQESYKTRIMNRIYELLINNTESFALITKKFVRDINTFPMIYLSISSSQKINLSGGGQADQTTFEIYILGNNPPEDFEKGGNEIMLDYTHEVEYALAKPMNWNTNHLGFPGFVIDSFFLDEFFYDDESSGSGLISGVLTFNVIHVGDFLQREYEVEIDED